jgi:hypothetical protein
LSGAFFASDIFIGSPRWIEGVSAICTAGHTFTGQFMLPGAMYPMSKVLLVRDRVMTLKLRATLAKVGPLSRLDEGMVGFPPNAGPSHR